MDQFLANLTDRLQPMISNLLGPSGGTVIAGSVTWADVGLVIGYLLLVVILQVAVALYLHRRAAAAAAGRSTDLNRHVVAAAGKPLYILIWIYGMYFAATPVLLKLRPDQGLLGARRVLNIAFDLGLFFAFFWFLFRATRVLEARLAAWAAASASRMGDLLIPLLGTSLRIFVIVAAVIPALPVLGLPEQYTGALAKLSSIILIVAIAVLLVRTVSITQRVVLMRFDIKASDNLQARKIYTQLHVISRVAYVVICVFAVAATLMLFQEVRQVGTSLLASAGIAGIIAGFAAQKTLANLFAGFQIAMAQPVRQDDVVVVEGEWGRIEEITLSYVVVHIWDDRRLVLPLSYFIEKPFQNWTRTSSAVTGTVYFWVDYNFPVEEGRGALKGIVESSPKWDRRFWNLQVTDASEKSMQLRVLATSADSSKSWDLRCEIREKFIAFIQSRHPASLPRLRAHLDAGPAQAALQSQAGASAALAGR